MWTLKKKMSWNQFDVRLLSSLARTQCAVGVAIRKTSYEPPPPLPFLLLPCIIHSPPMSHPPIHWALANTLQPCTNFQSIKWSQLKPNRRKGQGNSQIWLTVGHSRCTGADLTLTKWKQQKPPFQCIDEKGNQLYQIFILQQEFSFQYSWVLHISTTVAVADLS